jgi:hypothetical protein
MRSLIRNIVAVVVGMVAGSAVNMGFILASGSVIPPPPGADVTTAEGLRASMHLFEPRHFLFPFLAHAVGTFVGAAVAALLAAGGSAAPAFVVGLLFFLGGCANVFLLPAPAWFNAVDLLFAYLPPTWAAHRLVAGRRSRAGRGG